MTTQTARPEVILETDETVEEAKNSPEVQETLRIGQLLLQALNEGSQLAREENERLGIVVRDS